MPGWDTEDISDLADSVPGHPNIWTDSSRDEDLDATVVVLLLVVVMVVVLLFVVVLGFNVR